MEYAFIADIESLGSGGQMLDIVKLSDGQVVVVTDSTIVLYPDDEAFDTGDRAKVLFRYQGDR